ncbi:MAG: hypothetical protein C0473_03595 [Cyanobacteria bacterium DS3.002]|jgi:predicted NAD-dependent protein-ADP-ribosyltransferase YbiA (DUF1768 family)|nr:hypothetical protein [Cyanobacteria bacterium DS3.002]MBA4049931.1 hypothetical protein [Cyanobacteria bacterium DS2.008]MDQ5934633.1 hypothetical protein [Cyanobacteriota bacterium erpe_2018_sw_21hr_WHONDRS-SW48-000092_B_bin.40]
MPEDFQHSKQNQPLTTERLMATENKEVAQLSNRSDESLADKIFRETYLITKGTAIGFSQQAEHAWQNKGEAMVNLGVGVASALTLTYLSRGNSLKSAIGWGATAGLTAISIKDSFTHLKPAYDAVVDTYNSPANFESNLNKFSRSGGAFVFDTTVYGALGGMGGSLIGRKVFAPNKPSPLPEVPSALAINELGAKRTHLSAPTTLAEVKTATSAIEANIPELKLTTARDLMAPLNVSSKSSDDIGRLMSNFAETPFTLKGQRFASVEGFYQSLKFTDAEMRSRVANMSGPIAKSFGRKGTAEAATFEGNTFPFGSAQHHDLIKDALRAKLEQHPQIAAEFISTHPRPIVHDTGRRATTKTSFSEATFTRILSELRDELISKPKF